MPTYRYEAMTSSGEEVVDVIEADDKKAAQRRLAEHTGWNVSQSGIAIEGGWKPPSESHEDELLAALRSHHFVIEFDEQQRLTLCPPRGHPITGGLLLLVGGIGLLWKTTDSLVSFINDARARQQSMLDSFDWLILIPMLMIGLLLSVLGLMACLHRTRWTVDHNLLLVHSSTFCWMPSANTSTLAGSSPRSAASTAARTVTARRISSGNYSSKTPPAICWKRHTSPPTKTTTFRDCSARSSRSERAGCW